MVKYKNNEIKNLLDNKIDKRTIKIISFGKNTKRVNA